MRTNRATRLYKCNGVADALNTPLRYKCYHAEFRRATSQSVAVSRGEPPKFGSSGAPPPLEWAVADPLKQIPPSVVLRHIV